MTLPPGSWIPGERRSEMIEVVLLDNSKMWLNPLHIFSIRSKPDTVITFTTKQTLTVRDSVQELCRKIDDYFRFINLGQGVSVEQDTEESTKPSLIKQTV